MKTSIRLSLPVLGVLLLIFPDTSFGRGFGGARGGGSRGGGISRGGHGGGGAVRTPSFSGARQGGTRSATGSRGGAITRGGSITIGGTRGGVSGSRRSVVGHAGGVKVTTPGGRTITKGGASGAVRTPFGGAAGHLRGGGTSGPRGSVGGIQGRKFATDAGFGRYSGGVKVRGGGVKVVGHRTRAVPAGTRRTHAVGVRRGVYRGYPGYRNWFGAGWYARHPGAWRARRLTRAIWYPVNWDALNHWWDWLKGKRYDYAYGTSVVYDRGTVYYDSKSVATADAYYVQASGIAEKGAAEVSDEEEWKSLGVWAMLQGDETLSSKMLQIAVNKNGVIRGNYYDALTETSLPIQGSVDKRTQRAAWTVGKNDKVVFETGIYNLTKDETQILIHYGKETTQQWSLVRLEAPEETKGK